MRIDTVEHPCLEELRKKAVSERKEHEGPNDSKKSELKNYRKDLRNKISKLTKHREEINEELTKGR